MTRLLAPAAAIVALLAAAALPAVAARPLPDLVVTSVSGVPSSAIGGTAVSVRDTVVNHGSATAKASVTAFYLSIDEVKNANDIKLDGTRKVPALKGGRTSKGKTVVTIPSNLSGLFDVIACADSGAKVRESREANNCKVAARAINIELPLPPSN